MSGESVNMDKHPVLPLPSREQVEIMGAEAWGRFMVQRTKAIQMEREDPLNFGWEPLIWKVVDALFGFECLDPRFEKEIKERFGDDWNWGRWAEAMRLCLGFRKPVKLVLVNGGNRGSKTQYGGKRSVQVLYGGKGRGVWGFHNTRPMSQEYQMPIVFDHLPVDVRGRVPIQDGRPEYIAYKSATGFSNDKFVTHLAGTMMFKWYSSDIRDVEGGEIDMAWADEHVDSDRVHTLKLRVATRDGIILLTFTPTEGYTETVRMFQDGADVVRWCDAFLLPDDEGEALPWAAMGFESEAAWRRADVLGPASVPEDVHAWIENALANGGLQFSDATTGRMGQAGLKVRSQPKPPEGRKFKRIPRVMRCAGVMEAGKIQHNAAVVFFHSSDNPYGNPAVVYRNCMGKSAGFVKERFYGLAEKTSSTQFPKFDEKVHVVSAKDIPEQGTNYCLCDPSTGRNFVFLWLRVFKNTVYVYREWPGNYPIPGVGLPGPWAEIDGKKPDGRKGPAQNPFGFDLLSYKREIMRLEEWDVPKTGYDEAMVQPGPQTKEKLALRYIDARGSGGRSSMVSGTDTLLEQMNWSLNMEWNPVTMTRGNTNSELGTSVAMINDALYYNDVKEVDYTNRPKLLISEDCQNLIFAMKIWTNDDGNKGACKDFIDLLRYAYAQGLEDCGTGGFSMSGGGCH